MQVNFKFHPERCVGCGSCVIACINENNIDVEQMMCHRNLSKTEAVSEDNVQITYDSSACMHCSDASCMETCPMSCYSVDQETKIVVLDNTDCVGCQLCAEACPNQAIHFNKENKAVKCNGCIHRVRENLLPLCVAACPRHAITID